MTRLCLAIGIGAAAIGLTSCTKTEAKTPGPAPIALAVPEPPGRLSIPVAAEPPPPPPVETEKPAPTPTPPVRPRPTPTPTPPPSNTETTPPVVQTPSQALFEQRAREKLDAASRDLAKVKRENLSREAKEQYDSADRFMRMTRDALQARNYPYAAACAEKAATLAALLVRQTPTYIFR